MRALDEPVPEETASVCRALYVLRHGADPEGWAGCQALLTELIAQPPPRARATPTPSWVRVNYFNVRAIVR